MREKVVAAARRLGLDVDVRTLPSSTRTVAEAARSVGCEPAQIAKSIVFIADGEPVLVVASGAHRVDVGKLCDAFDCAEARPATADEACAATGYAVGGIAPVGHDLPVVFDAALLEHDTVYAAAGSGNSLFDVDPRQLAESIGATVAEVGEADDRSRNGTG